MHGAYAGHQTNLIRLKPEILNPSDEGVSLRITLIEQESRRSAAEEYSKPSSSKGTGGNEDYEVTANKGKCKDGKGTRICSYFNTERGCLKGDDCEFLDVKSEAKGKGKKGKQSGQR